jgi:hypothetical protein
MWRRYTPGCFSTLSSLLLPSRARSLARTLGPIAPAAEHLKVGILVAAGSSCRDNVIASRILSRAAPPPATVAARAAIHVLGVDAGKAGHLHEWAVAALPAGGLWHGGAASSGCRARSCCPGLHFGHVLPAWVRLPHARPVARKPAGGRGPPSGGGAHKRHRGRPASSRCTRFGMTSRHFVRGLVTSACALTAPALLCASRVGRLWLALRPFSAATARPRVELGSAGDQR